MYNKNMKYRIVKKATWWTNLYTTGLPQFLYFDFESEHFEVAGYSVARKHKWEFTQEEILSIVKEYPGFHEEFLVEVTEGKARRNGL